MRRNIAVLLLSLSILAQGAPTLAEDLHVFCAASLTAPIKAAAAAFEAAAPGTAVVLNLAAQGALLRQMEQGAPADVLITADAVTMDQAIARGLVVPHSSRVVAGNALRLFARADGPQCPSSLAGLSAPAFARLGLGSPETTAIGAFVKKRLAAEGLWGTLQSRLALGESIKQITQYLARGEVDAAFLFDTEGPALGASAVPCLRLDAPGDFVYPAARTASPAAPGPADAFLAFLSGSAGQAVLASHGLTPP